MRSLIATLAACSVLVWTGSAAAAGVPQFPPLPGSWSHAEINISIDGTPHTLILDRGVLMLALPRRLAIRESDGSVVLMPMRASTIVTLNGVRVRPRVLARGMQVETMRIDGGPAVRVRATF